MHVPDGYLSPSTCAAMYILAGGGWYAALKRIKVTLLSRAVPMISVFAAFSFVLMMFNLPLPGGTTGHAVGVAIATIVLGPSGAILAISITLAIQALFFGDGGITTLGANCFNMAVAGALVSHWSYKLLAPRSPEQHPRKQMWAGAIAGYLSINVAALLTAIEFGIQPMLFHDASGAPLYAPYPLRVAVPAMMFGHLTIAGVAEAVITGGMIAYLQKANPALLNGKRFAGATTIASQTRGTVAIWKWVAALLVLTPLGILATGVAWGEWSTEQLASHPALNGVPSGLQRLSALWTAPFPDYAPAFIKNEALGYVLSGMFGVGLLFVVYFVFSAWTRRTRRASEQAE